MRKAAPNRPIRCAIYTRKSSEEGLEQDFNSLDAQREACEATIASQKHEGWICLSDLYDDGGISGGTLERPGLKRLLADVETGKVDTIVVYKVDRLTRSLHDFAKLVDVFDRTGVSFISVTQAFNTTTSMGRLTLNMLLSFAQFEREVTGERIRDKIAASKKKGMWMGGLPPLGYDVKDRKLIVNEAEAETVRLIFQRYCELRSVHLLMEDLEHRGIVSKRRTDRHGRVTGGASFTRGPLYHLLQNRIYRGDIVHKGAAYPGQHEPIVEENIWSETQRILAQNRTDRQTGAHAAEPSLLSGLLFDDIGECMTPTHANKKGTRYRYYVSRRLIGGPKSGRLGGRRVPAADLENLVQDRLVAFLTSDAELFAHLEPEIDDGETCLAFIARAQSLGQRWANLSVPEKRIILQSIIGRIILKADEIEISMRLRGLIDLLFEEELPQAPLAVSDLPSAPFSLTIPARFKRSGMETRMLMDGPTHPQRQKSDHSLKRLIAQAHRFRTMVIEGNGRRMDELAAEAGVSPSYFARIFRLSFLAPGIVSDILNDRHPLTLTAKSLAALSSLPLDWTAQRDLFMTD